MTKTEMYLQFLKEEGYVPRTDDDGDIIFKVEGGSYLLFAAEDDQEFFRLAFPFFWEIESEEERQRALVAASRVTADMKLAKVYLVEDNVWASVEMLIDPIENFKPVFRRSLDILRHSVHEFGTAMKTPVQ